MNICNHSIVYVSAHNPETDLGVTKKIEGFCAAAHKKGYKDVVRIAGCDLWLEIIRQSHQEKTFYLVGGKQEVIDETIGKLKKEFPGIKILGYRNGYIKTKEGPK